MHTQSLNYSASLKPAPQRGFGGISQSVRQPGIIRVFPDAAHRRGDIVATLFWCWASVADAGPTLKQRWYNIPRVQTHNPWGMTATSPSPPPPPGLNPPPPHGIRNSQPRFWVCIQIRWVFTRGIIPTRPGLCSVWTSLYILGRWFCLCFPRLNSSHLACYISDFKCKFSSTSK